MGAGGPQQKIWRQATDPGQHIARSGGEKRIQYLAFLPGRELAPRQNKARPGEYEPEAGKKSGFPASILRRNVFTAISDQPWSPRLDSRLFWRNPGVQGLNHLQASVTPPATAYLDLLVTLALEKGPKVKRCRDGHSSSATPVYPPPLFRDIPSEHAGSVMMLPGDEALMALEKTWGVFGTKDIYQISQNGGDLCIATVDDTVLTLLRRTGLRLARLRLARLRPHSRHRCLERGINPPRIIKMHGARDDDFDEETIARLDDARVKNCTSWAPRPAPYRPPP
ncbi:hypothetical protein BDK51DRAFT_46962 [Blyttiomyces helicus]|uniref:Uncharacterized protein n=1 Tax=Blyttiomyces helicus TaxID=388810 RepID=A0A4P9WD67_9FUNG|nr:hypothetical protein BDK51DRAFT_46962 [Blyttiomyces helicus]|eukprot:RKO89583.1 hypothetical protein BDK51DRAFT_46962 [Blyttiomyces helicus]